MPNAKKVKKTVKASNIENLSPLITGIALFTVAAVVPLIVHYVKLPLPEELQILASATERVDLFSYYRGWVLLFCAAAIIFSAVSDLLISGIPLFSEMKRLIADAVRKPVPVLITVYVFFLVLSNVFTPYPKTSFLGMYDRYETFFIQLAYITVFLAAMSYARGWLKVKFLLTGLLISTFAMGTAGFLQLIGRDFFATKLGFKYVVGNNPDVTELGISYPQAYGTSFNPNTFGLVCAMLTPLMLGTAFFIFTNAKKRKLRFLSFAVFILSGALMLIGVFASYSLGGYMGLIAAVAAVGITLLARLIFGGNLKKLFKPFAVVCAFAAVMIIAGVVLARYVPPVQRAVSYTTARIDSIFEVSDNSDLPKFDFDENKLTITERGVSFTFTFISGVGAPEVESAGQRIEPSREHDEEEDVYKYTYTIPGYGNVLISRVDSYYNYRNIIFTLSEGRILPVYVKDGTVVDVNEKIPYWGFEGRERWASSRGYIFSRTFPLLPKRFLIGSGSDTFALVFPQRDVIAKLLYFRDPNITVDKAHNLYLQTAVSTGVVSALAIIGLFGHYLCTTFWALARGRGSAFALRLGIFGAVTAYSVSSLSTDSTLSSAPIFWVILGIGYGVNNISEEKT